MGASSDITYLAASRDEEEAASLVSATGDGHRGAGAASETRDTHLLSSAFFFVFLAYHAAQNLQSTVNTDGNLGSISLGLLYTSFTAFSVVGSPVVRRMGSRRALVLGTSGYLLFIAANLAPSCDMPSCYALLLLSAIGHADYAFLLFGTCRRRVRASLLRFLRFNSKEPLN